MNANEVLKKLIDLNIIYEIAEDNYLLTEKYKEQKSSSIPIKVNKSSSLNLIRDEIIVDRNNPNNLDWTNEIIQSKGRTRAIAVRTLCNVPRISKKGYRLHTLTQDAIFSINNIVNNANINPAIFISAVRLYYLYTEYPRNFSNFILHESLDIYEEHLKGIYLPTLNTKSDSNQQWG